jgi:uncharacterized protein (TIGR03066 family)
MSNAKAPDELQTAKDEAAARRLRRKAWRKRRVTAFLLLLLVGSAVASFVLFRYVFASVPRELVGTWQVVDGELKGATLEFRWYGTGYATMYKDGKKEVAEATVSVRGKRIHMTYKNSTPGMADTVIQTIVKLTDDELVIRDQDQATYHLIRIGD